MVETLCKFDYVSRFVTSLDVNVPLVDLSAFRIYWEIYLLVYKLCQIIE